jgi:hypothetical protein
MIVFGGRPRRMIVPAVSSIEITWLLARIGVPITLWEIQNRRPFT